MKSNLPFVVIVALFGVILYVIYLKSNQPVAVPMDPSYPVIPYQQPDMPQQPEEQEVMPEWPPEPGNYEEAVSISKKYNRPLFLYFTSGGCHWCKQMNNTFEDANVKAAMKEYIFFKVNTESNRDLTRKFGIGPIPSYVILNSNDQSVANKGEGYKDPGEFTDWLKSKVIERPKKRIGPFRRLFQDA